MPSTACDHAGVWAAHTLKPCIAAEVAQFIMMCRSVKTGMNM
jgi:hypothetical protein